MSMEIAVGVARRDLPLFSCSCTLHRLHVNDAACAARRAPGHLRLRHPPVFYAWWTAETAGAVLAVGVGAGGAGRDPCARQSRVAGAAEAAECGCAG
jgi:hypothetical protein